MLSNGDVVNDDDADDVNETPDNVRCFNPVNVGVIKPLFSALDLRTFDSTREFSLTLESDRDVEAVRRRNTENIF